MSLPEDFDSKIDTICELVANGDTVRQIASHMGVGASTIMRWVSLTPQSVEQYTRAREAASDMFECDIIETAQSVSPETAGADRVKIDALKWIAARRSPKKYGDKVENTLVGDADKPIISTTTVAFDKQTLADIIGKL